MKKTAYWVLGTAIVIQLIRPDFNNPKVDESMALSADTKVMSILKTSCYDCHSNETVYPWYHHVAPVSWIMANNINEGRKALDFSNWANIDSKVKLERLTRAKQLLNNELMPKSEYLLMHKNAALSNEQKKTLEDFFDMQIENIQVGTKIM